MVISGTFPDWAPDPKAVARKAVTWRKQSGSLQQVGFVLFKANEAYKLRENGMKVVRQIVDERIMKVIKDSGMDEAMTKVESVGTHQVDPAY